MGRKAENVETEYEKKVNHKIGDGKSILSFQLRTNKKVFSLCVKYFIESSVHQRL